MENYLVSYDIKEETKDPHDAFIKQAHDQNWNVFLDKGGYESQLPNTTLVGIFPNINEAEVMLFRAVAATQSLGFKCVLKKYIISQSSVFRSSSDVNLRP